MYYPTLRGKQFELIALRELSSSLNHELFCPIIEPVRSKLQALGKTIFLLNKSNIEPIVIVNPSLGDFSNLPNQSIEIDIKNESEEGLKFLPCFSTKAQTTQSMQELISATEGRYAVFIEEGISREMLPLLSDAALVLTTKYQRSAFKDLERVVIIEDNFLRAARNSDYPERSYFSVRHTDFKEDSNVCGFGDYTITGNDFLESGGPAFVVAIHLSYIDPDEFDAMYVRHFKSFDDNSPTRPGEKFGDALNKLVDFCDTNPDLFIDTIGLNGFRKLKKDDHFPGLGQVKKLSIQHHIETLAKYGN